MANLKPKSVVSAVCEVTEDEIQADTLTWDNGFENRNHEQFGVDSYFCDPHSPWQKPHVEQSIGLLRRWFIPKGTDLREVSEEKLQEYLCILNHKWRRSLNYKSAYEAALEKGVIIKKSREVSTLLALREVAFQVRI